ncbi:MAG: NAD-dependent dihydropyrimidine dehydrogenase subunit PreA [Treponema sp.]|nr:NAD-dependent dihydropyrimidine dehydrogenase subunit PreA [Treponema sp.]
MDFQYASQIIKESAASCLLCSGKNCTAACKKGVDAAKILYSLRFENYCGAYSFAKKNTACLECTSKECQAACLKGKITRPVSIQQAVASLLSLPEDSAELKDGVVSENYDEVFLDTLFCGVRCENPFFLSSSVVASNYEMIAKAFDEGWAGVAFKTIGAFVPEEVSPRFTTLHKENDSFVGFKNIEQISDHTLEENLGFIKRLKSEYPTKVIIASIMGRNEREWESLASQVQQAGADIIECNFSCPHMATHGLGSDVGQNPELVASYVKAVRRGTTIPILAKMTPNIGNMELPAIAAVNAGADGLAAINTIKSIMNVDLDSFVSEPQVGSYTSIGGYSGKAVKPIALRFIHDMRKCIETRAIPVSGMGGIESWRDAAEFISLGCGTVQVTTSVMQYGYGIINDMIDGIKRYLAKYGYNSVQQIVGQALPKIVPTDILDRKTRQYPKFVREKCVACGRCITSCYDGGHQALDLGKNGKPVLNRNCVGCQLCILVCPSQAIVPGSRTPISNNR